MLTWGMMHATTTMQAKSIARKPREHAQQKSEWKQVPTRGNAGLSCSKGDWLKTEDAILLLPHGCGTHLHFCRCTCIPSAGNVYFHKPHHLHTTANIQ